MQSENSGRCFLLCCLVSQAPTAASSAQCSLQEQARITPSASQSTGWSASVSGDVAIFGAIDDDDLGTNAGSVHVLRRVNSTWTYDTELHASDGSAGDRFGISVSLAADYAIVGADLDTTAVSRSGSAYVFRFDGQSWVEEAKILEPRQTTLHYFGGAVAISGDAAVIGARLDDEFAGAGGAAYIYRRSGSTWNFETKLVSPDPTAGDTFGESVAVDGNTVAIGASGRDTAEAQTGSAFVFRHTSNRWDLEAELTPVDALVGQHLGKSVALSGDALLVGSPDAFVSGTNAGAAYLFRRVSGIWEHEWKFTSPAASANDLFGTSVSLNTGRAAIGAPFDGNGTAWLYEQIPGGWSSGALAIPISTCENPVRDFGSSVGVADDAILVGARGTNSMFAFAPPVFTAIIESPQDVGLIAGSRAVTLRTTVDEGSVSPFFQWLHDGHALVDGTAAGGSTIIGATTNLLTIIAPTGADAGLYECVIFDHCAVDPLFSAPARVSIQPPHCPGDANDDRIVDFQDITRVLTFFAQPCP